MNTAETVSSSRVAILMCTFNGARYLVPQLESLLDQTHHDWVLSVSDDGSRDETLEILGNYGKEKMANRVFLFDGPRRGFARNFLSLLANKHIQGEFYAFCDQDDVWRPDHLERGIVALANVPRHTPALYCSRTRLIDDKGDPNGYSSNFERPPYFANALVQSLAGGNTMLMNNAARELVARVPEDVEIISHDWVAYLLVSGCGGVVIYDPEPTIDYRQHGANQVGANRSLSEVFFRIRRLFRGEFRHWVDCNLRFLESFASELTEENRRRLRCFARARQRSLLPRLMLLARSGVYRQSRLGSAGIYLASCLKLL